MWRLFPRTNSYDSVENSGFSVRFVLSFLEENESRGGAVAARLAHNQEVAGSNPAPATTIV